MAKKKDLFDWEARIKTLPEEPGVYLMKDKEGKILYIGKANNLKRRVRQYFQKSGDPRPFVRKLPRLLGEIDILMTHTEKEALLLEATLIQKNQPRFNILLKEEQRYLYITLDPTESFPRLEVVRRGPRDKAWKPKLRTFGPYRSWYGVRQALEVASRCFRLRSCDDREMRNRTRPCMEYQIKRCDAPCCLPVKPELYQSHVDEVLLFLEGKHKELIEGLTQKMWDAADKQAYEIAAHYRDQIGAIRHIQEQQQTIHSKDRSNRDIYGLYREGEKVEIQLLLMREGKLSGGRSFSFDEQEFEDNEVLANFLSAFYLREGVEFPSEILLPLEPEDVEGLAEVLQERSPRKVRLHIPQKGDRAQLVELACKNAEQGFLEKQRTEEESQQRLQRLQKRLGLARFPFRIECVDNSHMQGRYPVSSLVVFEGGYANRSAYRRYHLKTAKGGDDYGSMKEVLTRRFRRGMKEGNLPDLLLVDGGRGQLRIAQAVLKDLELDGIELAAIAKKRSHEEEDETKEALEFDRIYRPDRKNPILVHPRHAEMLILAKLRDEAHRTAVTFHKKVREREKLHSVLDDIPGIGEKRRKALLQHLGNVKRIREATLTELRAVPGISDAAAKTILRFFASKESISPHTSRKTKSSKSPTKA